MSPTRFLSPSLALLALLAGGCHPDPQRISPPEDPDDGPPGPAKTLQHCLEEERHPGEDEVIKRVESSYDDAGRLTRKTTDGYYADGQPDVIVVYAYDDEGRLASETTKWTDRTHQEERRYLYSADGRLDAIETWAVDEDDDELRSVEVHEYEAGRLRRRVVAGPDRIADEDPVRWDYEYRPDGSLARMVYQWPPPSEAALISLWACPWPARQRTSTRSVQPRSPGFCRRSP